MRLGSLQLGFRLNVGTPSRCHVYVCVVMSRLRTCVCVAAEHGSSQFKGLYVDQSLTTQSVSVYSDCAKVLVCRLLLMSVSRTNSFGNTMSSSEANNFLDTDVEHTNQHRLLPRRRRLDIRRRVNFNQPWVKLLIDDKIKSQQTKRGSCEHVRQIWPSGFERVVNVTFDRSEKCFRFFLARYLANAVLA